MIADMSKTERNVNIDQRDGATLDKIEIALSVDRFAKYVDVCGGNRKAAFRLYGWNTAVSAAFYGPLQMVEVTLRNSLHAALSAQYGLAWYENVESGLDAYALKKIDESRRNLLKGGRVADPSHMVANLSFGFWVSLLSPGGRLPFERGNPAWRFWMSLLSLRGRRSAVTSKANYEMTLWRPALWRAFPNVPKPNRRAVHRPFEYMRLLRNRIAHHKPIYARRLDKDYESILTVLNWMSPEACIWVKAFSRIPDLLAQFREAEHVKF